MLSPGLAAAASTKEPFLPCRPQPDACRDRCKAVGLPTPVELRPPDQQLLPAGHHRTTCRGRGGGLRLQNLLLRRVAVLSDHEAYGQALASGFMTRFTRLGGSIIDILDLDPNSHLDLTAFMRHAKAMGLQAIYTAASPPITAV